MASTFAVTQEDFDWQVKQPGVNLVYFWATWCPPCRALAPIMEELANEYHPYVRILKINADETPELLSLYNISGLPTFLIMRDGLLIEQFSGGAPKSFFQKKLSLVIE